MKQLEYRLAEVLLKRIYGKEIISEAQYLSAYRSLKKQEQEDR